MGEKILGLVLTIVFGYITYRLYKNNSMKKALRTFLIILAAFFTLSSLIGPYTGSDESQNKKSNHLVKKARVVSDSTKTSKGTNEVSDDKKVLSDLNKSTVSNADDYKYQIQNHKIIALVKNSYVLPPVTVSGDTAYLQGIYKEVVKVQKKHGTQYPLTFRDDKEVIGYTSFDGHGWYKDLTDQNESKSNYNFKDGIDE